MNRLLLLLTLLPNLCHAYAGPGMALSSLMGVLALLGGILLLVVGTVWYPVKRLLARLRTPEAPPPSDTPTS